ncbi:MAG: LysR family transcriptional regulator [Pseudomonadota bacterium]
MLRLLRFRDLEYFIAVSEQRSFARAAKVVGISQPTLSNQIKRLEDVFGQKLLERSGKDVMPTPEGLRALNHMKSVMHAFGELNAARDGADTLDGKSVRIGLIPSIAPYLSGKLLHGLNATRAQMRTELVEALTADLETQLVSSEIDLAITATLPQSPSLQAVEIGLEKMVYLSSETCPENPLSGASERPILLLQEGHCFRDLVHASIKRLNNSADARFDRTIGSASLLTLTSLARQGIGDTVVPAHFVDTFPELVSGLHRRLLEPTTFSRHIFAVSRKVRTANRDIAELRRIARDAHQSR